MVLIKIFHNNTLVIKDTQVHSNTTGDVALLNTNNVIPPIRDFSYFIQNALNTSIIVNVRNYITNTLYTITSTETIPKNSSYFFRDVPITPFSSLDISAVSIPTGYVTGYAIINYNYSS